MTNNRIVYQLKTFVYAARGILHFFKSEFKAWIHLLAGIAAVLLAIFLKINPTEWLFIIVAIGLVFMSEITNTVIEKFLDKFHPEQNSITGKIKDMMAAVVLISAVVALIIGIVVFIPYIIELWN